MAALDYQDLSKFTLPAEFRGKPSWFVQLWWLTQSTLFALSPQFMYGWWRFLLSLFGAKIGCKVIIRPSVKITYPWKLRIGDGVALYTLGEIEIGNHAVVSQKSYLCTGSHDYQKLAFDIFAKKIIRREKFYRRMRCLKEIKSINENRQTTV